MHDVEQRCALWVHSQLLNNLPCSEIEVDVNVVVITFIVTQTRDTHILEGIVSAASNRVNSMGVHNKMAKDSS